MKNFYPCPKLYQACRSQWGVSRSWTPGPDAVSPVCVYRSLWKPLWPSGSAVFCSDIGCNAHWHGAPAGGCLGNLEGSFVPQDYWWTAQSESSKKNKRNSRVLCSQVFRSPTWVFANSMCKPIIIPKYCLTVRQWTSADYFICLNLFIVENY